MARKRIDKEKIARKAADLAGKAVDAVETAADKTEEAADKLSKNFDNFMQKPEVAEAAEAVSESVEKTKESVKEAVKTARTRVSEVKLELFETSASITAIENAVKKDAANKGLKGDVKIYINAEERAVYYTVNGESGEGQKIRLKDIED